MSKCKQFQQNVIPLHVAPTTLALCFFNSIIHASIHHFPLQLSYSHRSYHYPTWRTTYLKAAGDKHKYGGMVIFQRRYNMSSTEGTRDSFSLSALLPTLRAFVRFPTDQPSFVVHTRPSLHSFLYASIIYIIVPFVSNYLKYLRTSLTDSPSSGTQVAFAFVIKYILFFTLSYSLNSFFFILTSVPMGLVTARDPYIFFGSF